MTPAEDGARRVSVAQSAEITVPDGTSCVCCGAPVTREEGAGLLAMPAVAPLWTCVRCHGTALRLLVAANEAGWLRERDVDGEGATSPPAY